MPIFLPKDNTWSRQAKLDAIRKLLNNHHPVICAIFQPADFGNNTAFYFNQPAAAITVTRTNHAICIIGYNDHFNGGSFLIKNNYPGFGTDGMAWVNYDYLLKLIVYAGSLQVHF